MSPIIGGSSETAAGVSSDGWVTAADTWTYASATTFTISGIDRTAVFTPGTRLKLTNSTLKYFVVVSSAFATNTTVTVTGGADYSLANAAITSPFYSYAANPQGYPGWFTYTPTATGFSATTTLVGYFCVNGRECTYQFDVVGTSNATTFTVSLPIAAAAATGTTDALMRPLGQVEDNSVVSASFGLAFVASGGGSSASLFPTGAAGAWTAAGTKYAKGGFSYPI